MDAWSERNVDDVVFGPNGFGEQRYAEPSADETTQRGDVLALIVQLRGESGLRAGLVEHVAQSVPWSQGHERLARGLSQSDGVERGEPVVRRHGQIQLLVPKYDAAQALVIDGRGRHDDHIQCSR